MVQFNQFEFSADEKISDKMTKLKTLTISKSNQMQTKLLKTLFLPCEDKF